MASKGVIAAARCTGHEPLSLRSAFRNLLENLSPPLTSLIRTGDRVLIKVNMGCSGLRSPADRVTTHPLLVEEIVRAVQECGAKVFFGDDVARVGKHCRQLWTSTGMWEVAQKTGAQLVDFVAVGAREVRGGLSYPRKYLVTNAYFDADVVINAASCRSHPNIILSGAIKNMFGLIVGRRKSLMHDLFWNNTSKFARVIADIYRTIPAQLSFLDLTSVREGQGVPGQGPSIQPVGLLLAGTDPVALDTVAAHAIGYDQLPIWTTQHAHHMGLGENDISRIQFRGLNWATFEKCHLRYPLITTPTTNTAYERISSFVNHTVLRPRPVISARDCTGCGDCADRCPVHCIGRSENIFHIELSRCVDCGCCLKVCEENAVNLEHVGLARAIRTMMFPSKSPGLASSEVKN